MSRRWATTAVFFVNGAVLGTFVAQIPWIQERFDLSKSAMGLVLVGMSLAVILTFPIAGQAVVKLGSERVTRLGGIADALAVNLVVLAPQPLLVAAGLFVLGASSATMDVAMNSHGVSVERALRRPIMSSLHAGWSFGGMLGAGLAAGFAAVGVDPRIAVAIASVLLLAIVAAVHGADRRRLRRGGPGGPGLHAAQPRAAAAGGPVPAGDGHRGRDGRLGRALPAPGPRDERRGGRAGVRVLHRRHDRRARWSATGSPAASGRSACCAGARC